MLTFLVIGAAFVGVAALVGGVAMLLRSGDDTNVADRLDALAGIKKAGAAGSDPSTDLLADAMDDVPGVLEHYFLRVGNVRLMLEQANIKMEPFHFLALCLALIVVGGVISVVAGLSLFLAPLVGISLGALPFVWLWMAKKKRLKKFGQQLPEALELISRALRAGHSLGSGFQLVCSEMSEPLGPEFGAVFEEQNLGVPLEEALYNMTERVPNLDLKFFATAVVLQRQTGGDLAEILDKIGHLIRERFKIYGQIQALTGEGRLSGIVLLALPPALFVVMLRLNPKYVMVLFEDPLGIKLMTFAIISQVLGALVIRKIVNIKV